MILQFYFLNYLIHFAKTSHFLNLFGMSTFHRIFIFYRKFFKAEIFVLVNLENAAIKQDKIYTKFLQLRIIKNSEYFRRYVYGAPLQRVKQ